MWSLFSACLVKMVQHMVGVIHMAVDSTFRKQNCTEMLHNSLHLQMGKRYVTLQLYGILYKVSASKIKVLLGSPWHLVWPSLFSAKLQWMCTYMYSTQSLLLSDNTGEVGIIQTESPVRELWRVLCPIEKLWNLIGLNSGMLSSDRVFTQSSLWQLTCGA